MTLTYELLLNNGFTKSNPSSEYSNLSKRGNNYTVELLPKLGNDDNPIIGFEIYCTKYQKGNIVENKLNMTNLTTVGKLLEILKIMEINIVFRY